MGLNRILNDLPREHGGRPLLCWASQLDGAELQFAQLMGVNAIMANLPGPIDFRPQLPPVFDQKHRGSCVAEGAVGVKAYQELLQGDYPSDGLSIPYVYTRCKQIDGFPDGEGTTPKAAMTVLQQYGVCNENVMPRSTLLNLPVPKVPAIPAGADGSAARFKIGSAAQICSQADADRSALLAVIRMALASRGPFTMALLVCSNFEPDGNELIPLPEGNIEGGHQIVIAGDLPDKKALILRNSWGPGWGENGYAYLPYEWLTHSIDMTGDGQGMWAIFEAWTALDAGMTPTPRAKRIVVTPDGFSKWMQVDGVNVELDQPAYVHPFTNRTLVPLRAVGEHQGYQVDWDGRHAILTAIN